MNTPHHLFIVSITAFMLNVCDAQDAKKSETSKPTQPPITPDATSSKSAATTANPLLALFDPNTPLVTGQEVRTKGVVEYNTPAKNSHVSRAYARFKVANGQFGILLDSRGEEMARTMDGKTIEVRGTLTGKATFDMTSSLSSPTSGTISKVTRNPELKIEEFKVAP